MSSVLQKVFSRIVGRQAERDVRDWVSYRSIVESIADGTEPPIDKVEAQLKANGKSADDLAADVKAALGRRALRATIRKAEGAKAERERINREIEEVRKELQAAQQRYDAVCGPLQENLLQIEVLESNAHNAKQKLASLCDDQLLGEELLAIKERMKAIAAEVTDSKDRLVSVRDNAQMCEINSNDKSFSENDRNDFQKQAVEMRRKERDLWNAHESARKEQFDLDRQLQELKQRMIDA